MATGKEIKRLRGNVTAAKVAALMGVNVDKLRKWEERDSDPRDTGDIQNIETYFGVSLDQLPNIESFDFVETKPGGDNYKDKYIKLLENQVNYLSGQLRHLMILTHAKVATNQQALSDLLVKQKIAEGDLVEDRLGKDNLQNYQKLKGELGIL